MVWRQWRGLLVRVVVLTRLGHLVRAEEEGSGDTSLELAIIEDVDNDIRASPVIREAISDEYSDYDQYGDTSIDDLLSLDNPSRGDMEVGEFVPVAGEDWTLIPIHNDFLDTRFCKQECQAGGIIVQ